MKKWDEQELFEVSSMTVERVVCADKGCHCGRGSQLEKRLIPLKKAR